MKSRLILPVMIALVASETFAGDLSSTGASAANWIPASPHQVQGPGIEQVKGHRGQPVELHSRNRAEYLQGVAGEPASIADPWVR